MKTKLFFVIAALTAIIISSLQKANAQSWVLKGNGNANDSSKLGTLKNFPLKIYTNNIEQMRITPAGNVGIGITSPLQKLDVNGNINIAAGSGLYIGNYRMIWSDHSNSNFLREKLPVSPTPPELIIQLQERMLYYPTPPDLIIRLQEWMLYITTPAIIIRLQERML